jgi:glycosyltransferase involved in cell wall biosynthesis
MKIALLHYSAPPIVGGVETVMGHHARMMVKAGNEVRIIAGRGEQIDQWIPFLSIPYIDSRHERVLRIKQELDHGHVPADFEPLKTIIIKALRKAISDVDIVIIHNVCSLAKNLPLTAALKEINGSQDMPYFILWHHDLAWVTPRYAAELHPGYPWDLLRMSWNGVTQVTVSELRRQELSALYEIPASRIHVIPNGIDLTKFYKLEQQTVGFIQSLDLLNSDPLLLLPVRITARKNIELAIRIVDFLKEIFPKTKLIVTGPLGPHNPDNEEYFNRLVSLRTDLHLDDSVHFLAEMTNDYLPDAVIADFYRLADVLLLPSREEGFGIPILEAGLARLPVFCSNLPPLQQLGREFVHYFSPDDKPQSIAEKIDHVLKNSMNYQQCVRVRREYSWEQIYWEKIEPILNSTEVNRR